MARPGKSIAKQSEGRVGEKYLPLGGRVKKLRAIRINQAALEERNEIRARNGKEAARCPSCSQNAHDKNVLVRCAQSRVSQAVLEKEEGNSEDARSESPPGKGMRGMLNQCPRQDMGIFSRVTVRLAHTSQKLSLGSD